MAKLKVKLVKLPRSLRRGIERRQPRHPKFKDLTGQRFERCRVAGFAGYLGKDAAFLCYCDCGNHFVVRGGQLTYTPSWSCGCEIGKLSPAARRVQGLYTSIKLRCYNPADPSYRWYGGRGIKVCKRWRESIEAFAQDMGPRPSSRHIVVRRNKRRNYTPMNCYWGTRADALRARRGGALREITYGNKMLNLAGWAKELGISREAMRTRVNKCLARGLDVSLAISGPIRDWGPGQPRHR